MQLYFVYLFKPWRFLFLNFPTTKHWVIEVKPIQFKWLKCSDLWNLECHKTSNSDFYLHQWFVVCSCFHSCWCVVLETSTCRISKPMLLSLEAHGTSERRCVAKHVFVLSRIRRWARLIRTLVRFPLWCGHIGGQNKTTCEWWSLSASKQILVWSDCLDSVHQTCCGFWVLGNIFWYASC